MKRGTIEFIRDNWDEFSPNTKKGINQNRQTRSKHFVFYHKSIGYKVQLDETMTSFLNEQLNIKHQTGPLGRFIPRAVDKVNKFNHEEYKTHKNIDKKNK